MRSIVLGCIGIIACSSPSSGPRTAGSVGSQPPDQAGPPGAPQQPPALRLPGDVRPTQYALDLTIIPDQQRSSGRVSIAAQVVRPTRVVWLNATGLSIDRATLGGQPARVIAGGEDFVGFTTGAELAPGPLAIEVAFGAPIERTKSLGLYAVREGEGDWYAYTFFEPLDARRAFPCFDEPAYKVPWQLTFHVKRAHTALANAPVVRESDEPNGMKRVELAVSKPLPSYLVAYVVGPFELVDGGTAGRAKTPIRFVIPKGRAGELRYAKEVTPKVVTALEDYFDMPYPYIKLDVAVVPRFWGTMEHPGIVAMGQPLTLIRPDQETRQRRFGYANILAHELAHYWFGDVVTMAWWDDTWLNESLGQWMDMIITDAVEPGFRHRNRRPIYALSAMASDEALVTQQIRLPVTTKEAIGASFDGAITYNKGASLARMFEAYVGPEKWRAMIRAYIRAFEWKNATADDLLGVVRQHLGAPIETGMRSFLEQPGVPRISAKLSCNPGQRALLQLAQQRALPAGTVDPADKTWTVPVCARHPGGRACALLEGKTGEIVLEENARTCPAWTILNADATGYYRSVVDPKVAKALLTPGSATARAAKPTTAEKIMLMADLRAMVTRDELPLDRVLELAPLVAADPDEQFASAALGFTQFRGDALDDALHAKAERYAARTFGPLARRLGWTRGKDDSDERHELRRNMLGFVGDDDPALAKQAGALVDRWLVDRTGIADDLVDAALDVAAERGDAARFDKLLAAAKAPRDRTEQNRLLGALGGFHDPALVARALELVGGTAFDPRETLSIVYGVLFERKTRALGLAYVTANIDAMLARMRDDDATGFLGALAGGFCTAKERAAMEALVVPRAAKYNGAQARVARGLERSQQCITRMERDLPAIRRLLARY